MVCCGKCKKNESEPSLPVNVNVSRIIFSNPATVVFWGDGTKTIVKAREEDEYSPYYGFLAALGKKVYGSNARIQSMIDRWLNEPKPDPEREEPKPQ